MSACQINYQVGWWVLCHYFFCSVVQRHIMYNITFQGSLCKLTVFLERWISFPCWLCKTHPWGKLHSGHRYGLWYQVMGYRTLFGHGWAKPSSDEQLWSHFSCCIWSNFHHRPPEIWLSGYPNFRYSQAHFWLTLTFRCWVGGGVFRFDSWPDVSLLVRERKGFTSGLKSLHFWKRKTILLHGYWIMTTILLYTLFPLLAVICPSLCQT